MASEAKSAYDQEYRKQNIITKLLTFNVRNDRDMEILQYLQSLEHGTANAFIKDLIYANMKGEKEK